MLAGVAVQALKGYTNFELLHYLQWFVLPGAALAVLFAVLSVFVQVLVPHKFLGWAVMLLYLVATVALENIGFEHNLYLYAGAPDVPLSDMNGMGRFAIGRDAFLAYWGFVALMLLVLAYGLWVRGANAPLRARLRRLPQRLRGTPAVVLGAAAAGAIGLGGWIYYNTNVLNEYVTTPRARAAPGGPREGVDRLRVGPAADDRRRQARRPALPARRARGHARRVPAGEPDRQAARRRARALAAAAEDGRAVRSRRCPDEGVRPARLPHLPARAGDGAGRAADDDLRHHAGAARLQQQPAADSHRRERDLRRQHRDHAVARHVARRPAAGTREAPQARARNPSCGRQSWRTTAPARTTCCAATPSG